MEVAFAASAERTKEGNSARRGSEETPFRRIWQLSTSEKSAARKQMGSGWKPQIAAASELQRQESLRISRVSQI